MCYLIIFIALYGNGGIERFSFSIKVNSPLSNPRGSHLLLKGRKKWLWQDPGENIVLWKCFRVSWKELESQHDIVEGA